MSLKGAEPTANLPRRQQQTLLGLLQGLSEKQIAYWLGLSKNTVHVYVKSIYRRFGVSSAGELLAGFVDEGKLQRLRETAEPVFQQPIPPRLQKRALWLSPVKPPTSSAPPAFQPQAPKCQRRRRPVATLVARE